VGVKTGSTAHLSANVITHNATALQGPGNIISSGNKTMTGNTTQGSYAAARSPAITPKTGARALATMRGRIEEAGHDD